MLLRRLSRASKLHILTNTGYYGAANDKFLPPHAFTESADQLAARWIREAREGIDGTGIKPAFMKIGVDAGPLSDVDAQAGAGGGADTSRHRAADLLAHRQRHRGVGAGGGARRRARAAWRVRVGARAERIGHRRARAGGAAWRVGVV